MAFTAVLFSFETVAELLRLFVVLIVKSERHHEVDIGRVKFVVLVLVFRVGGDFFDFLIQLVGLFGRFFRFFGFFRSFFDFFCNFGRCICGVFSGIFFRDFGSCIVSLIRHRVVIEVCQKVCVVCNRHFGSWLFLILALSEE